MGKRIITQRRGHGGVRYRAPSRYRYKVMSPRGTHGVVTEILHDQARSSPLVRIKSSMGTFTVPATETLSVGATIHINDTIQSGDISTLARIPTGTPVHSIESFPGSAGIFCRAAGTQGKVVEKKEEYVVVQLPSKKLRRFHPRCMAIIGVVAGSGKTEKPLVKAGTKHHAMKARNKLYPHTSGVAMNAVAHPFGSGRGRHMGKSQIPKKNSPPGRNVGLLRAQRTGKK